jgi:hypothetical protein
MPRVQTPVLKTKQNKNRQLSPGPSLGGEWDSCVPSHSHSWASAEWEEGQAEPALLTFKSKLHFFRIGSILIDIKIQKCKSLLRSESPQPPSSPRQEQPVSQNKLGGAAVTRGPAAPPHPVVEATKIHPSLTCSTLPLEGCWSWFGIILGPRSTEQPLLGISSQQRNKKDHTGLHCVITCHWPRQVTWTRKQKGSFHVSWRRIRILWYSKFINRPCPPSS